MDLLPPLKIDEGVDGKKLENVNNKSFSCLTLAKSYNNDPFFNVDFCSFKLHCLIGRGSYSNVWKAQCKEVTVALKVLHSNDEVLQRIFYHEVEVMRNLIHPNIVGIMGACVYPVYAIAMEYMACGSLDQLLHESRNISYKADHAFHWASQCIDALAYIHKKGFAHGDLKTANLLLADNCCSLKIADFGTMVYMNAQTEYKQGTASWTAPEIITGSSPSKKSDIYSFGIILWEIITRARPYSDCKNAEEILWSVHAGLRPSRITGIPTKLMEMIERCWQELPEERPSIEEIQTLLDTFCRMYPNASEPLTCFETSPKQRKEVTDGNNTMGCGTTEREAIKAVCELSPNLLEEIEALKKV